MELGSDYEEKDDQEDQMKCNLKGQIAKEEIKEEEPNLNYGTKPTTVEIKLIKKDSFEEDDKESEEDEDSFSDFEESDDN